MTIVKSVTLLELVDVFCYTVDVFFHIVFRDKSEVWILLKCLIDSFIFIDNKYIHLNQQN